MKMLKNKLIPSKGNIVSAILAMVVISLLVLACGNSKPEMPNDATVQSLVKATLSDFTDAVNKGDFASFRDKSSKDFQDTFTADKLKTSFQDFIDKKDVVVPILQSTSGMTPKFSPAP